MNLEAILRNNSERNISTFFPRWLMFFSGASILFPFLWVVLPFLIVRDISYLHKKHEVPISDERFFFYILPLFTHVIGVVIYLYWRRRKLRNQYNIPATSIERKIEDYNIPISSSIYSLAILETFILLFAITLYFMNQVTIALFTIVVFIVLAFPSNLLTVYYDLKKIHREKIPWSPYPRLLSFLFSPSYVFYIAYILARKEHVYYSALYDIINESENLSPTESSLRDLEGNKQSDYEEADVFTPDN